MPNELIWRGQNNIKRQMQEYERRVYRAVVAVAEYMSAVLETYAKMNAPWTDRTANARQSLHAFVRDESPVVVRLFLAHGVEYGVYLETRWQGRYSVIWPTLSAHFGQILKMLQDIFA